MAVGNKILNFSDGPDVLVRLDDEAGILTRRVFGLRDGLFLSRLAAPAYLSTRRHNNRDRFSEGGRFEVVR